MESGSAEGSLEGSLGKKHARFVKSAPESAAKIWGNLSGQVSNENEKDTRMKPVLEPVGLSPSRSGVRGPSDGEGPGGGRRALEDEGALGAAEAEQSGVDFEETEADGPREGLERRGVPDSEDAQLKEVGVQGVEEEVRGNHDRVAVGGDGSWVDNGDSTWGWSGRGRGVFAGVGRLDLAPEVDEVPVGVEEEAVTEEEEVGRGEGARDFREFEQRGVEHADEAGVAPVEELRGRVQRLEDLPELGGSPASGSARGPA